MNNLNTFQIVFSILCVSSAPFSVVILAWLQIKEAKTDINKMEKGKKGKITDREEIEKYLSGF